MPSTRTSLASAGAARSATQGAGLRAAPRRGAVAGLRLGAGAALVLACVAGTWRLGQAAQVATGFASQVLCDDVFITGADPARVVRERLAPLDGMRLVNWALRPRIDPAAHEVRVSLVGGFESLARWRDGVGCTALPARGARAWFDEAHAAVPVAANTERAGAAGRVWPEATSAIAADAPVDPLSPALGAALGAALERAIPARASDEPHRTKAVVVRKDGRLVGERYAAGYGLDTPVLGFSLTKSVTNALVGILVREGRLALDAPAPIGAWRDVRDPHHAITVEQLLRQTSGLDVTQDDSGFDANARVMYTLPDKAAAAASARLAARPGARWRYSDANYVLLSRLVRDAAGGDSASVQRFLSEALFAPLGLRHASIDFDASGTPLGSSHMLASARDWARFGQLYLDDGVVDGRRLLPEGWVARSVTPTSGTTYGAGFWTNRAAAAASEVDATVRLPSAPADAFFARGFMGQFIVVVPSERLVVVRLSVRADPNDDIAETDRLVADVRRALAGRAGPAIGAEALANAR